MSRYMKRRNIGLLIALTTLVIITALGFNTRTSSQPVASVAPASAHRVAMPNSARSGSIAASAANQGTTKSSSGITVIPEVKHDLSIPLRDMAAAAPQTRKETEHDNGLHGVQPYQGLMQKKFNDPVLQKSFGPLVMPTPIVTFEGLGANGSIPPDTNGEVGPNHYVQWINTQFAVYNKTGTRLIGPLAGNTLWSGFGGPCQTTNDGDPIAMYDQLADRWFMSQFAWTNFNTGPFYQCIAISQTGDPTGQWHRYQFTISPNLLNDYPHFGIWPDAYYMTANLFTVPAENWAGSGQYAFDRIRMLAGQTATVQIHQLGVEDWGGMLPSDLDGTTLPPAGAPNTFVEVNADEWSFPPYVYLDELQIWQYHVDWINPANSTFTGPVHRATAAFDGLPCADTSGACVHQPGTSVLLDSLYDRDMYRLAYRNFGDHESIVFNHTVDANGANNGYTGVRWYEIRSPRINPVIYQQSTYAPDAISRWMGSMAMDRNGDIAVGYSVSDGVSTYPGIRYAGRLISDPLNELTQGEAVMQASGGSQTGATRWGDYSMLSVDPTDDCTFWYTNEYYPTTSSTAFHTRIGSFKFPSCTGGGGTPTPTFTPGVVTNTPTRTPVCGGGTPTWTAASPVPTARGRAAGATIGNNVFVFGGRPTNTDYTQTVYKYDTAAGTWTLLSFTMPDANTSNMNAGVLTFPEGVRAFIVGGSGTGSVVTGRTLAFNPSDGSFTPKAPWPASPVRIPGGSAVVNNKLYVFGGFNPLPSPGTMYNEIWMYDPTTNAWTQSAAHLSIARGYIATEAMPDGLIYLAGGSQIDAAGSLTDETVFEKFNPSNNTIVTGPPLLEAKSNNQGYLFGGKFYVPAGGYLAANHNTNVQIYDPTANSWSMGGVVVNATRNYTKGYGADGALYMFGGLDPLANNFWDYNQKLAPAGACSTPTNTSTPGPATATNTPGVATATNTPIASTATNTPIASTATGTPIGATSTSTSVAATGTPGSATSTPAATNTTGPTRTATSCPITFTDVQPSDYFYAAVRYLYCQGAISGYSDGTFRPYNDTTRGQLSKIIVLARGWPIVTTGGPHFTDVLPGSAFYIFVETAFNRNIISGYSDGTFRPNANVTRGQLSKIIVLAFGWSTPPCPTSAHFTDVPTTHAFFCFIETAYAHGVIAGYTDGTFRPQNNATRGQISVIIYRSLP